MMNSLEFAEMIAKMPVEIQNKFFESLKNELTETEWKATVEFIGLVGMMLHPTKYEAVKNAVCDTLCEEFYGYKVERKNKIEDPCNPVYMTTIL